MLVPRGVRASVSWWQAVQIALGLLLVLAVSTVGYVCVTWPERIAERKRKASE